MPVFFVTRLADLVKRWHIPSEELLSETGLTKATLEDPFGRFPITRMCDLLARARLLTGEPGLGYYDGLQARAAAFGTLGFAALSAPSVREALRIAIEFAPVFSTALSLELHVDGTLATLALDENTDLGSVRDIVIISMMLGLQTMFGALTGRPHEGLADLALEEPAYQPRFAHLVPQWRFGRPGNRLLLDAAALDAPIVTADPSGLRVAQRLCERAIEELGFDAGLVDGVRSLLAKKEGGFRSVAEVAWRMQLSERTLKRRLAAQGTTFSMLVERERREMSMILLRSRDLSLTDVARRLDYATVSTFVRAFHHWTGTTPAAYRRTTRPGVESSEG